MTSQATSIPIAIAAHPSPEMVRVIEHRKTHSDLDVISVQFGDRDVHIDLIGSLDVIAAVVAEVARQLVAIKDARRGEVHP